jgi:hypothetical protein
MIAARGGKRQGQGSGIRDQGSGIRDQGSGIRDQGSGIRDQGSGIRDQGSGIRDQVAMRWWIRRLLDRRAAGVRSAQGGKGDEAESEIGVSLR